MHLINGTREEKALAKEGEPTSIYLFFHTDSRLLFCYRGDTRNITWWTKARMCHKICTDLTVAQYINVTDWRHISELLGHPVTWLEEYSPTAKEHSERSTERPWGWVGLLSCGLCARSLLIVCLRFAKRHMNTFSLYWEIVVWSDKRKYMANRSLNWFQGRKKMTKTYHILVTDLVEGSPSTV